MNQRALEAGARAAPVWSDDALYRLLGAMAGVFDSSYRGQFPKHHTRKIALRDAITKPLREVADQLESDMRRCQESYKREKARAMLSAATTGESDALPDGERP